MIGCCGGGSNFAGLAFPFIQDKINGADIEIIGAEPYSCPTLTKGTFMYDHGDIAKMTPLITDVQFGPQLYPCPNPCWRIALPRNVAACKCGR